MELRMDLVNSLNTVNQMTIGRNLTRYSVLQTKPTKTASELFEMESLERSLQQYSTLPALTETRPLHRKEERLAAQCSVVLNQSKFASARLNGVQTLEVHRASTALGKLMSKAPESLSVGEKADMVLLKSRLLRFVGMEGYPVTDADFQVIS